MWTGINANVARAGFKKQTGGKYVSQHVDKSLLSGLGPRAGRMSSSSADNCGTTNPSNLGASSQTGGGCGCSDPTASYGFVGGKDLGDLRGSYAPVSSPKSCPAKGGSRKRKGRKGRKSRKGKKRRRKVHRTKKRGRKAKKRSTRNKRLSRRNKKRGTRKHRRRMKGGYYQFGTDRPFSTGYSAPVKVSPKLSAMANPVTYKRYMIAGDNYNHFTGKNTPSPILDQAVSS